MHWRSFDGSNLRFEYSKKLKSFTKFGTRHCLFDESDPQFGPAIQLFMNKYSEDLIKIIQDSKQYRNADYVTAFCEFFGPNSFAGQHDPNDVKDLILFDIQVHKKGLLGPREFLDSFGHLSIPIIVYEGILNDSFINDVKENKFNLNEGVVCKGGSGHERWSRKIKTLDYLNRLKNRFGDEWIKYGE